MRRISGVISLLCIPVITQAANVGADQVQVQQYSREICIQKTTDDCINTICLTSSSRDCQDQCRQDAEVKCKTASQ